MLSNKYGLRTTARLRERPQTQEIGKVRKAGH